VLSFKYQESNDPASVTKMQTGKADMLGHASRMEFLRGDSSR
jgi:hypothetical protein